MLGTPLGTPPGPQAQVPGSGFYQIDEPTAGLSVGQLAPELEGEVDGEIVGLRDLDGRPLRLADLRGEPVWLSFFATWCPPCQEETPVLREAWDRYGPRGLQMIAVSVQETTPDDVAAWADTYDLRYPIGFDATSAVFHAYAGLRPAHARLHRSRRRHPPPAVRSARPRAGRRHRGAAPGVGWVGCVGGSRIRLIGRDSRGGGRAGG